MTAPPGIGDTVRHPSGWAGRVRWLGTQPTLNGPVDCVTVAFDRFDGDGYCRPPGSFGRVPARELTVIDHDETGGAS